jgi:hypothetical protein
VEHSQQTMNHFWISNFRAKYDKTSSKESAYDMIMGMDLMTSIRIRVDCEHRCRWDGTEIPLKTRSTLNNDELLHMLYHAANKPDILQEAEKRHNRI